MGARTRLAAVIGTMGLLATLLATAPASASAGDGPEPVVHRVQLGETTTSRVIQYFSAVPLPAGATTVVFDYAQIPAESCTLMPNGPTSGTTVDLVGGRAEFTVEPLRDGSRPDGFCTLPAPDGGTRLDSWVFLVGGESAAQGVVGPEHDRERLTFRHEEFHYTGGLTAGLAPSDVVQLVGAPGLFLSDTTAGTVVQTGGPTLPIATARTPIGDGSTAIARLPGWQTFAASGVIDRTLVLTIRNARLGDIDGVEVRRTVDWIGPATFVDVPSSVRVAVSSPTATSFRPIKAIVRVTAPDLDPALWSATDRLGALVVKVDGREVARSSLYTAWDGRWVVTLPKLSRGTHRVTAEYSGSPWIAPSVSDVANVRVLI